MTFPMLICDYHIINLPQFTTVQRKMEKGNFVVVYVYGGLRKEADKKATFLSSFKLVDCGEARAKTSVIKKLTFPN